MLFQFTCQQINAMKNVLTALLLLLTVMACSTKKNTDPEPDLSGTYQMTRLIVTSSNVDYSLPAKINGVNISGVIVVNRTSNTELTWEPRVSYDGQVRSGGVVPVVLRKASGKGYEMTDNGYLTGTIDGTTISLDFTNTDGRFSTTGRK